MAPDPAQGPGPFFEKALAFVRKAYPEQLESMSSVRLEDVTPGKFFAEYAWVVHATGFSAKAVGNLMPRLMAAYGPWDRLAWEEGAAVLGRVRKVVNHPQKISAVHAMAGRMAAGIRDQDWGMYRSASLSSPEKLAELPYIGRVTCFHLARNVGLLEAVKPDLHLVRLADLWGFASCEAMCEDMRDAHLAATGERMPLGIVDLCVWYACSTFGTLGIRREGAR